jgi:stearoyl-CoA desaturase (delta-9 desaturase)
MASSKSFLQRTLRDGRKVHLRFFYMFVFAVLHILALVAFLPMFVNLSALAVFAVMAWLSGGLGVTLGYHRLLTHRSFVTYKPIEYALAIFACLAWQGGPVQWVGTHRLHHSESDEPGDPHSPRDGFTWSHILWIVHSGRPGDDPRQLTKDIQRDPVLCWINRYWYLPQFLLALLLFVLGWKWLGSPAGGLSWVLWGVCVRVVVMYHATWFVNSAAHTWGYRNFPTKDNSRNNWWVALLSFGEGWHNNHHAQQRSAAHGMRWYEVDLTYWTILFMRACGLAWKVVKPQRPGA